MKEVTSIFVLLLVFVMFSCTMLIADAAWYSKNPQDFNALLGTSWTFYKEENNQKIKQLSFSKHYFLDGLDIYLETSDASGLTGVVYLTDQFSNEKGDHYFIALHPYPDSSCEIFTFKPYGKNFSGRYFVSDNDSLDGPYDMEGIENISFKSPDIVVPDDFPTIGEAITNSSDGNIIFVKSGVYNCSLYINKPITLIGDKNVVLSGGGTKIPVTINTDNVKILNMTISNGDQYGVKIISSDYCVIQNVIISSADGNSDYSGMDGCGLYLDNSHYNRIDKCDIKSCKAGNNIYIAGDAYGLIMKNSSFNQIQNCHIYKQLGGGSLYGGGDGCGVYISNSHNIKISQTKIEDNDGSITGDGFGLYIKASDKILVTLSEILRNFGRGDGEGYGVKLINTSVGIFNCDIRNNNYAGISVSNQSMKSVILGGHPDYFNTFSINSKYNVKSNSQHSIIGTFNEWNNSNPSSKIYDCHDNYSSGCVIIEESDQLVGDVDGNGQIDVSDLILILKNLSNIDLSYLLLKRIDINIDGSCGFHEAIWIMKLISDI